MLKTNHAASDPILAADMNSVVELAILNSHNIIELYLENFFAAKTTPFNGLFFDGFSDTAKADTAATTLTAGASSGQKILTVADSSVFKAGQEINIFDTTNLDVKTIDTIDSGTQITLNENLDNTYISTDDVQRSTVNFDGAGKKIDFTGIDVGDDKKVIYYSKLQSFQTAMREVRLWVVRNFTAQFNLKTGISGGATSLDIDGDQTGKFATGDIVDISTIDNLLRERKTLTNVVGNTANTHTIDVERSSSQFLSASDSASLSITGDITFEAWVNVETAPTEGQQFGIMSKQGTGDFGYEFRYRLEGGVFKLTFTFYSNASGATASQFEVSGAAADLGTGTWVHLACAVDVSVPSATIYIDGVAQTTNTLISAATSIFDNSSDYQIGATRDGATDFFFDGKIDDVRLWSVIRTGTEIADNRSLELVGNETSLEAYHPLNNSLLDRTANNNDLTNNGSAVFQSADLPFTTGLTVVDTTLSFSATDNAFGTSDFVERVDVLPEISVVNKDGDESLVSLTFEQSIVDFANSEAEDEYLFETVTPNEDVIIKLELTREDTSLVPFAKRLGVVLIE